MMHLTIWKDHVESILYLEVSNHVKRWICATTKIGPVLDVKVCYYQANLYFVTGTVALVRIVNGINKDVTETSEEIPAASAGDRGTGKFVAKAGPRPASTITMSLVSVPYRERKWIDIEPGKFSYGCFEVSKFMIRLLRHDGSVHREDEGAVRIDDLAEMFKSRFAATSHWPIQAWISYLAKGGRTKEKVSVLLEPSFFRTFLVLQSNPRTFRRYSR